jgi:hypothetical protein
MTSNEHQKILERPFTMTLAELFMQVEPSFPVTARKDLKTAVRVLARALDCPDPEHCPLDLYNQPLPSLYLRVEQFLMAQEKKSHTIRNTKNHISRLFRLAQNQGLFSLTPPQIEPRYDFRQRPSRPGAYYAKQDQTSLPFREWSLSLQNEWLAYQTWATAPLVPGRSAHLRKRQVTVDDYRAVFETYFGYLQNTLQITPTFDHLFDIDLATRYVLWHINERHHKTTITIRAFLDRVATLARQYRPMPDFVAQIVALKKTVGRTTPSLNKDDAWVSLAKLDEIGRAIWPRRPSPADYRTPQNKVNPGRRHAAQASYSLMFRLWTYIPYRQRNIREMQLGTNLHRDVHGTWRITFRGDELKVGSKRGQTNTFDLPFPSTLVPLLEDYLYTWRPALVAPLPHPEHERHVFLTQQGKPHWRSNLTTTTSRIVYTYTGKHWHPHIIRSVWATEWIRKSHGDFYTAAVMLNDNIQTVIAKYAHLLQEDVAENAYRLIDERNGQGK